MEAEMIKEALLETGWKSSFAFPTASRENMKLIELVKRNILKCFFYNSTWCFFQGIFWKYDFYYKYIYIFLQAPIFVFFLL